MLENLLRLGFGFCLGWLFGRVVGFILLVSFVLYCAYYVNESEAHKAERLTDAAHWQKTQAEQSGHAAGNGWYTVEGDNTWGVRPGATIKVQDGQAYDAHGRLLGPVSP